MSSLSTPAYRNDQGRPGGLLLVGSKGFIPDCNLVAVMHELPHLVVHSVRTLPDTLQQFEPAPVTMLVYEDCIADASDRELELLGVHDDRTIAIVIENIDRIPPAARALLGAEVIKGILPMNLRLELWLLALRLLMRGGEYAPISLARSGPVPFKGGGARTQPQEPPELARRPDLTRLTPRELEVLRMLSTGCPNRVIAERFSLSEHTVKVHVHNVIRKLSAKNRTAAAAIYLESSV